MKLVARSKEQDNLIRFARVFLNGREIYACVLADEEAGKVVYFPTDEFRRPKPSAQPIEATGYVWIGLNSFATDDVVEEYLKRKGLK